MKNEDLLRECKDKEEVIRFVRDEIRQINRKNEILEEKLFRSDEVLGIIQDENDRLKVELHNIKIVWDKFKIIKKNIEEGK